MITVDEYVRRMLNLLPSVAKDAFDPQVMMAYIAEGISKSYGQSNPKPDYPSRKPVLNYVTGNLFKAATVYKAKGNVSQFKQAGNSYSFFWGIDLNLVPYARIHEYGGQAGRNLMSTIPARPYAGPGMVYVEEKRLPEIIDKMLRKLAQATES